MIENLKILSLMRFQDSYLVSTRAQLFQNELNWIFMKSGSHPDEALFISYAYKGENFPAYFQQLSIIFDKAGIKLTDINSGDPAGLIAGAQFLVVGGGDILTFFNRMDSLISPAFNPYFAIMDRVQNGVPYVGWNEGSAVVSPKYFVPPSSLLRPGINASPFEIICGYADSQQSDSAILNFLLTNPSIPRVIGQPKALVNDGGSSVRLEETGGGMINSPTSPYPIVITYTILDGNLNKS
jgi:hypothetical protein